MVKVVSKWIWISVKDVWYALSRNQSPGMADPRTWKNLPGEFKFNQKRLYGESMQMDIWVSVKVVGML